tara:strand:+ start:151 stop:747 length:597 start_codon:yes stop_codon:yes gene_type:complete
MAITINGNGTLTGISVGGLPDGIVDTDMLAASAVTGPKLGAGAIIQTVTAEHSAEVDNTGNTYTDTGLSASITPSSSSNKILVIVSQGWYITRSTDQARGGIRLLRGSTVIEEGPNNADGSEGGGFGVSTANGPSAIQTAGRYNLTLLDSPSTTSATTYKTQFCNHQTGSSPEITINKSFSGSGQNGKGYITLMEVVA